MKENIWITSIIIFRINIHDKTLVTRRISIGIWSLLGGPYFNCSLQPTGTCCILSTRPLEWIIITMTRSIPPTQHSVPHTTRVPNSTGLFDHALRGSHWCDNNNRGYKASWMTCTPCTQSGSPARLPAPAGDDTSITHFIYTCTRISWYTICRYISWYRRHI